MQRNIAIVAVVGIVVAVGIGAYLYMQPHEAPHTTEGNLPPGKGVVGKAASNTDPFDITITLTDDGFTPRDITVPPGTRVRFLNASKDEFWPASGIHPTHTLYPEKESTDCLGSSFDACDALAPGYFYDFTFYYEGRWPYHDHLHGYYSGSITVAASTSTAH